MVIPIASVGGEQGITIDESVRMQPGSEVLAGTLGSQFDQLGIIIIIVAVMGIVQSEKANGMLAFILTRRVPVLSYIFSKIITNFFFVACSALLGYMASYLYTCFLFTDIPGKQVIAASIFYIFWLFFIVSFTTMISTIFNSQGVIALISIVFLLISRMIVGFYPSLDYLNPASMGQHAIEMLVSGNFHSEIIWSMLTTILFSALAISISIIWISHKKCTVDKR